MSRGPSEHRADGPGWFSGLAVATAMGLVFVTGCTTANTPAAQSGVEQTRAPATPPSSTLPLPVPASPTTSGRASEPPPEEALAARGGRPQAREGTFRLPESRHVGVVVYDTVGSSARVDANSRWYVRLLHDDAGDPAIHVRDLGERPDDEGELLLMDDGFTSPPALVGDVVIYATANAVGTRILHAADLVDREVLWQAVLDEPVFSDPVVFGRQILVVGQSGTIVSFDLASGEEQWRYATGGYGLHLMAATESTVFVGLEFASTVVSIDRTSGDVAWMREDLGGYRISELTVANNLVIAGNVDTGTGLSLVGLDAETGETVWAGSEDAWEWGHIFGRNVLAVDDVIVGGGSGVGAIDATTRELLWATDEHVPQSPVVIRDDVVYYLAGAPREEDFELVGRSLRTGEIVSETDAAVPLLTSRGQANGEAVELLLGDTSMVVAFRDSIATVVDLSNLGRSPLNVDAEEPVPLS